MATYYKNGVAYDGKTNKPLKPTKDKYGGTRLQSAAEARREDTILSATPPFKSKLLDDEPSAPAIETPATSRDRYPLHKKPKRPLSETLRETRVQIGRANDIGDRPAEFKMPPVYGDRPERVADIETHGTPRPAPEDWTYVEEHPGTATFYLKGAGQFTVSPPLRVKVGGPIGYERGAMEYQFERILQALQRMAAAEHRPPQMTDMQS